MKCIYNLIINIFSTELKILKSVFYFIMADRHCYACNLRGKLRQMPRIGENEIKKQIAVARRNTNNLPNSELDNETRICFNCNLSINNEIAAIEANPMCLRLNVLKQRGNSACVICNALNYHRLTMKSRVDIFIRRNIYAPQNVRVCNHHLDDNGLIIAALLPVLQYVNRPYVIPGAELQVFLEHLRTAASSVPRLEDINNLDEDEFYCLFSLNKRQFHELLTYCDRVPEGNFLRYIYEKDLLAFLCKIRQGLSDEFLKVLFNYSSRQATSLAIKKVRMSLMGRFVPRNIRVNSIGRQEYINLHVTPFANELYNENPENPKAIVIIDATYAYINKSSNFRVLRQSYSLHKWRHLLKPTLLVGMDGFILDIFGPYFADYQNNDAAILQHEFERDIEALRNWFQNGDIVLVDRGYRDVIPFLNRLGISYKMPALLERGQHQLTTEQANDSRIITKMRWIVESRNGHKINF